MRESHIRQSNIETLRIISMFLVLLYHSIFLKNGLPTHSEILSHPTENFFNLSLYAAAAVCVNVFVLISGWFGIHNKKENFQGFLFQIIFYFGLGYCIGWSTGTIPLNGRTLFNLITLSTEYWFVYAYLGLLLLAPLLNIYIDKVSASTLGRTILLFYLLQTWYGWFRPQEAPFFYGGHSTMSFIGLYLTARYCHLYIHFSEGNTARYIFGYSGISLFVAGLGFTMLYFNLGSVYASMLYQYTSPFILASSLLLFLGFTQWTIPSKTWINRVALSAFSVYLIHTHNGFYPYMEKAIAGLRSLTIAYPLYLLLLFGSLAAIYLLCTAIDQIRLTLWRHLQKKVLR